MAQPAYTTLLYENFSLPLGFTVIGGPPAGYRWVITDVVAVRQAGNPAWSGNKGFQIIDDTNAVLVMTPYSWAQDSTEYRWEGRQVVDNPHELLALTDDDSWSVRITGFTLTLP